MKIDYDPRLDKLLVTGASEHGDEISRPLLECVRRAIDLERKACAKAIDKLAASEPSPRSYEKAHYCMGLEAAAAAIRARGPTT